MARMPAGLLLPSREPVRPLALARVREPIEFPDFHKPRWDVHKDVNVQASVLTNFADPEPCQRKAVALTPLG